MKVLIRFIVYQSRLAHILALIIVKIHFILEPKNKRGLWYFGHFQYCLMLKKMCQINIFNSFILGWKVKIGDPKLFFENGPM